MTLTVAWWLFGPNPETDTPGKKHPVSRVITLPIAIGVAGMPYDAFNRGGSFLRRFNRGVALQRVATSQHAYMVRHGMKISRSSAAHFAHAGVGRARTRLALRFGAKMGARLIPGLGWALLAYDVYTVTNMILDD